MSGYERYWLGRGYWSDIVRNSRTLSRLIWFHVPARLSPKTPEEVQSGQPQRSAQEVNKVMAEKRMALDLIYGFALAVKHHLRGETGIYYEDLYPLVRPLHDHEHTADDDQIHASTSALPSPRRGHRITTKVSAAQSGIPSAVSEAPPSPQIFAPQPFLPQQFVPTPADDRNPIIPPINAYGTFDGSTVVSRNLRRTGSPESHVSSISSVSRPLLPSSQPPAESVRNKVSRDLIPFAMVWNHFKHKLGFHGQDETICAESEVSRDDDPYAVKRRWAGPVQAGPLHMKQHPKVAGHGENLPVEILRCLSEWFSVLEDRNVVPGSLLLLPSPCANVDMDSLTGLERILTTPLPFVYSVHIRHTVWVYLFFLPLQLVSQFGYYTIPGVAIAAFIYLGFVAAGEEIEQPFGYDDNDLDLDLFCKAIIGVDINHLKSSPALNAHLGPLHENPTVVHRRSLTLNEMSNRPDNHGLDQNVTLGPV
ncbi:hypothetical protein H1R20_g4565, partial [Candolleomyces eurysporus]